MLTTSERPQEQLSESLIDFQEITEAVDDVVQRTLRHPSADITSKSACAACSFGQYVRDRPIKSVLVASVVGLLIGRFSKRR